MTAYCLIPVLIIIINHLLISSQNRNKEGNNDEDMQKTGFLDQFGLSENDYRVSKDTIFVLTPFSKEHYETYKLISEICINVGFKVYRGDEEFIKNDILPHIIKQIVRARFVIAIIDGRNPNVYYELGIAHALNKPTIIVSKTLDAATFDIKSNRIIIYNDYKTLANELTQNLTRALVKN